MLSVQCQDLLLGCVLSVLVLGAVGVGGWLCCPLRTQFWPHGSNCELAKAVTWITFVLYFLVTILSFSFSLSSFLIKLFKLILWYFCPLECFFSSKTGLTAVAFLFPLNFFKEL